MIRIEECILYRDFAEGEVLRDMTILVETYKKLVNAQISLKDRRFRENMSAYEPQFYEALNRLVEMANRYGFSGNLWHDYLTYLLVNKKMHFLPPARLSEKSREASTRWQNMILPFQRAVRFRYLCFRRNFRIRRCFRHQRLREHRQPEQAVQQRSPRPHLRTGHPSCKSRICRRIYG